MEVRSLMKNRVHTEHCCILHGCKYDKDNVCTVVHKIVPQSNICESCDVFAGIHDLNTLNKVMVGEIPRCPHYGRVL